MSATYVRCDSNLPDSCLAAKAINAEAVEWLKPRKSTQYAVRSITSSAGNPSLLATAGNRRWCLSIFILEQDRRCGTVKDHEG